MKAPSLILALIVSATSAQAFSGPAGPHFGGFGGHRGFHSLGRYGGYGLVPDEPAPVEPLRAPAVEPPAVEAPAFAPEYPLPYAIPAARPRHSGPKIIYIGEPPKKPGVRVIYGTD